MIDHELSNLNEVNYKHIEDIIDARKELGQYNVNKQPNPINYRYVYSTSSGANERFVRFNDLIMLNDGDTPTTTSIKHTDSEITIVRIRRNNNSMKKTQINNNKWDMHDVAIPGDGSHLGESPSLVNLATLVAKNVHHSDGDEYLVPLSSWDPYIKSEENPSHAQETRLKYMSELSIQQEEQLELSQENKEIDPPNYEVDDNKTVISEISGNSNSDNEIKSLASIISRRPSLAGRISKFIRKHCKKTKTLSDLDLDKN